MFKLLQVIKDLIVWKAVNSGIYDIEIGSIVSRALEARKTDLVSS